MPHWKSFLEKEYIGCWDLERDVTVEITAVTKARLEGTASIKANSRPVLSFKGTDKKLIVNSTIGTCIQGMYGPQIQDWIGKRVTLYPTTCAAKGGAQVECVRVRPTVPKGKAEALEGKPVDEAMRARQAAAMGREPGEEG